MKKTPKFKSAEHKRQQMELQASWEKLQKKYEPKRVNKALTPSNKPVLNVRVAEIREHESVDTGVTGAVTTGAKPQVYTGDKMIGIATMHKSNMVPIFNDDAAKDVSKMRR